MNYQQLHKMLTACLAIAPKNDVRYYLNGIHIKQDSNGSIIEATDGNRIVCFKSDSKLCQAMDFDCILDVKYVKLLVDKIKAMGYDKLDIYNVCVTDISTEYLTFDIDRVDLIDGKYPDTKRVMWQDSLNMNTIYEIGVDARFLADIVKISKPFTSKKHQPIKMEFKEALASTRITIPTNIDGLSCVMYIMPCRL